MLKIKRGWRAWLGKLSGESQRRCTHAAHCEGRAPWELASTLCATMDDSVEVMCWQLVESMPSIQVGWAAPEKKKRDAFVNGEIHHHGRYQK
jgi:hypothetical protein